MDSIFDALLRGGREDIGKNNKDDNSRGTGAVQRAMGE